MPNPTAVALMGVRFEGIQGIHYNNVKAMEKEGLVEIVAACEAKQEDNAAVAELVARNVPVYSSPEALLANAVRLYVQVIVNSLPHYAHAPVADEAINKGKHVFLEKPPALTIQSANAMVEKAKADGILLGVNYEYFADRSYQILLQEISKGTLGNIERIVAFGDWRRNQSYYTRAPWVGRRFFQPDASGLEVPVLDGCLNNQFPHLLLLAYKAALAQGSDGFGGLSAELYRGHRSPMEMEDTAFIKFALNRKHVLFYGTTCSDMVSDDPDPMVLYVHGDKGTARWSEQGIVKFNFSDGKSNIVVLPETKAELSYRMLRNFIGQIVYNEAPILGIEQAMAPVRLTNAAYQSSGEIHEIPEEYLSYEMGSGASQGTAITEASQIPAIKGYSNLIRLAAGKCCLPSQLAGGAPGWVRKPKEAIKLDKLTFIQI